MSSSNASKAAHQLRKDKADAKERKRIQLAAARPACPDNQNAQETVAYLGFREGGVPKLKNFG